MSFSIRRTCFVNNYYYSVRNCLAFSHTHTHTHTHSLLTYSFEVSSLFEVFFSRLGQSGGKLSRSFHMRLFADLASARLLIQFTKRDYLCHLVPASAVGSPHAGLSSAARLDVVLRTRVQLKMRAFAVAGQSPWNNLPTTIRMHDSLCIQESLQGPPVSDFPYSGTTKTRSLGVSVLTPAALRPPY